MVTRKVACVIMTLLVVLRSGRSIEGHLEGQRRHPNVIVMIADDLGIGDIGCYGNHTINTPNIDKLADEGVKLTQHLAPAAMCTPSRAGLLTARYPFRYGLAGEYGTLRVALHIASQLGLPFSEFTLAEALTAYNYTTAAVGKWHLGSNCGYFGNSCNSPKLHGFQHFYGTLGSLLEECRGDHPFFVFPFDKPLYQGLFAAWIIGVALLIAVNVKLQWKLSLVIGCGIFYTILFVLSWFAVTHYRFHTKQWWQMSYWMHKYMNGIIMHNEEIVQQPIVLDGFTQNILNYSTKFIEDHATDDNPFFLYHSFGHVHTPMFIGPGMSGRSKHGRYGDNIEEMDMAVGVIMDTVRNLGIDHNTIFYFVSDHGGHLEVLDENGQRIGGYNGLFKGGKGQGAAEGGIRVPGIYRWKGRFPAGVSVDSPTSLMDMMPTVLDLVGIPPVHELMPNMSQNEVDGISIAKLLFRQSNAEPRVFLHHCAKSIHALRWAKENYVYKMFLKRHKYHENSTQCGWGIYAFCNCFDVWDISDEPLLFDLSRDVYEDHPISPNTSEYQEVVGYLRSYLSDWEDSVHYPPSQFNSVWNSMHSFWLQPVCVNCS
ncbi:hypothetical protein SK128_001903 [Halocaridina rubra]|uniref:Sulfatase N-terminal domain-containing protein n=1 Tax=Halocaridina rubra TaxID=373956 RepID=A0AAN8XV06_HALRR